MDHLYWLAGLVLGDGYLDDRHVEVYNSSESILREVVVTLRVSGVSLERVKVDVYCTDSRVLPSVASMLGLPLANVRLKRDLSPWKANLQKLRVRISSKALAGKISRRIRSGVNKSFVKGLFDAEASVDAKGYVEFKQVASQRGVTLVKRVHAFLVKNRIACTLPNTKKDAKKTDCYFYVKDVGASYVPSVSLTRQKGFAPKR